MGDLRPSAVASVYRLLAGSSCYRTASILLVTRPLCGRPVGQAWDSRLACRCRGDRGGGLRRGDRLGVDGADRGRRSDARRDRRRTRPWSAHLFLPLATRLRGGRPGGTTGVSGGDLTSSGADAILSGYAGEIEARAAASAAPRAYSPEADFLPERPSFVVAVTDPATLSPKSPDRDFQTILRIPVQPYVRSV